MYYARQDQFDDVSIEWLDENNAKIDGLKATEKTLAAEKKELQARRRALYVDIVLMLFWFHC